MARARAIGLVHGGSSPVGEAEPPTGSTGVNQRCSSRTRGGLPRGRRGRVPTLQERAQAAAAATARGWTRQPKHAAVALREAKEASVARALTTLQAKAMRVRRSPPQRQRREWRAARVRCMPHKRGSQAIGATLLARESLSVLFGLFR